jgi:hypothetical protein
MKPLLEKGIGLFIAIIFIALLLTSPLVFQEGNPIPVAIAAFKISVLGDSIAQIDNNPETYMVKARNNEGADKPFMDLKAKQGYVFKNRAVGPYFEENDQYYRAEFRMFTRNYMVIEVKKIDYWAYPNDLK